MKKKKLIPVILIIICLFIFIEVISNLSSNFNKPTENNINEIIQNENDTLKKDVFENAYQYKIVYELSGIRLDGGNNYYVLIDPVDLNNDSFKDKIKSTIKKIIYEKDGNKISIDILDNSEILELYYKSHYGANTLGRVLNKNETDQLAVHLIASYSGDLSTMLYRNQLDFFPSAPKDNVKVGQYIKTLDFN